MDFLNIPNKISHSISRESFASDISVFSFSSLSSDWRKSTKGLSKCQETDELLDWNDPELNQFREEILEQMLQSGSVNFDQIFKVSKDEQRVFMVKYPPFRSGKLYKSLSTSDIADPTLLLPSDPKHCCSVPHFPCRPLYVFMLQYRRRQLRDVQRRQIPQNEHPFSSSEQLQDSSLVLEQMLPHAKSENKTNTTLNASVKKVRTTRQLSKWLRKLNIGDKSASGNEHECRVDPEKDKGRPLTPKERSFVIFHWLKSIDDGS